MNYAIDILEKNSLDSSATKISEKIQMLHKGFESKVSTTDGAFINDQANVARGYERWLNTGDNLRNEVVDKVNLAGAQGIIKQMYEGRELGNGQRTLGLKELSKYGRDGKYEYQNTKQQAGFAAEIIGTAKDNLFAEIKGNGIKTFRADDRPDLFPKNDQFVDKIRISPDGNIVDRIQVKFVGRNGGECLMKLASPKYDKYFDGKHVDKIEIPREFYKEIRHGKLIENKIQSLEKQLANAQDKGDIDLAQKVQKRIDRFQLIDKMIEKSRVSSKEAVFARMHPDAYVKLQAGNQAGLESGIAAASMTAAVSTVDNVRAVLDGKMDPLEAFTDTVGDVGLAGTLGYGTGFVSRVVANSMTESSHELIASMGKANVPATAISFGIASYDSISDYATGSISGKELAYDLSENAVGIAGSALAGAAAGSIVPGIGTVGGFAVGLIGGTVGYAVTTEAYKTAMQYGIENAPQLEARAKQIASETIDYAKVNVPDKVNEITTAINDFANKNQLSFNF